MPQCPKCKAKVDEPERVHDVIVEPAAGERGITKREVGMYRCSRCDTLFPRVLSRRKYLLVPETEFASLKKEVSSLKQEKDELVGDAESMKRDHAAKELSLKRAKEKAEIEGRESQVMQLEAYVEYLRAQKEELEKAISY